MKHLLISLCLCCNHLYLAAPKLPEVEPCCCWLLSPCTCGVTWLNSVVVLRKISENIAKCIYFVYNSLAAGGLRLHWEKNVRDLLTFLTTNDASKSNCLTNYLLAILE